MPTVLQKKRWTYYKICIWNYPFDLQFNITQNTLEYVNFALICNLSWETANLLHSLPKWRPDYAISDMGTILELSEVERREYGGAAALGLLIKGAGLQLPKFCSYACRGAAAAVISGTHYKSLHSMLL